MRLHLWFLFLIPLVNTSCQQVQRAEAYSDPSTAPGRTVVTDRVSKVVVTAKDTQRFEFMSASALYADGWDTLAHPQFWKQIMCLSPDSCIINVASSRIPIQTACFRTWASRSEYEKSDIKSKLREENCVDHGEEVFVTSGKREFYEHRKSITTIGKAIGYFESYGTDPWYAQTILLIESPGKHTSSSYAGAKGPFQLMRSVAIQFGLKVNKHVDERTRLDRASYGASRLLSTICIPRVKTMLEARSIPYNEKDLWFRLLVLHAYHAGAGNLSAAINKISPVSGGRDLITTLWKTQAAGFKNESQNYSQIALAALLNFDDLISIDGDTVFSSWGDKSLADAKRRHPSGMLTADEMADALLMYEKDLGDGTIGLDQFMSQWTQFRETATRNGSTLNYPVNEMQLVWVAGRMMHKRQSDDAIKLLLENMALFPMSKATAIALSRAYGKTGKTALAQKYMVRSNSLSDTMP